jgi:hypothetical protein
MFLLENPEVEVCVDSLIPGKVSRCEVGERGAWLASSHQPCPPSPYCWRTAQQDSQTNSCVVRGDKGRSLLAYGYFRWHEDIDELG